jgi:hypothetical protein
MIDAQRLQTNAESTSFFQQIMLIAACRGLPDGPNLCRKERCPAHGLNAADDDPRGRPEVAGG